MSNTLRIALIGEGVTDYVVLSAAMESMLSGRSFDLKLLQPEGSLAFTGAGDAGPLGGGWKGVYKWCIQSAVRGSGHVSDDPVFVSYDLMVVHLDADVAGEDPANDATDPIPELAGRLPCEQPCPPASATTGALRAVMSSWLGEAETPPRTVLCTPSKSTEAWRSEEHTSELQSPCNLVCRLLLEKKKIIYIYKKPQQTNKKKTNNY